MASRLSSRRASAQLVLDASPQYQNIVQSGCARVARQIWLLHAPRGTAARGFTRLQLVALEDANLDAILHHVKFALFSRNICIRICVYMV